MGEIEIRPFAAGDTAAVIGLILPIQREEFGIPVTAEDQPDLAAISSFYQAGKGGFWVAARNGIVVGTIGLRNIGNDQAALRKMFVAADMRGREHGVGIRLLTGLLAHARSEGLQDIFLGTTEKFLAAHRFYEKNGFIEIAATDLPAAFPRMAVDTKFYRHRLAAAH